MQAKRKETQASLGMKKAMRTDGADIEQIREHHEETHANRFQMLDVVDRNPRKM